MSESLKHNTYDAIVVGGGSVGLHTSSGLHEAWPEANILNVTADDQFGGQTEKSLEQFRQFNESESLAEMVDYSLKEYDRAAEESGQVTYQRYPYIFTVGRENPSPWQDILPENTPDRPTIDYYQNIKDNTESWGYDPRAEIVSPEELRYRYPLLDGDDIEQAMIVEECGRLHFATMKSWLMEKSKVNSKGQGVTYKTKSMAEKILFDKAGKAKGIQINGEVLYSDKIILALGSRAVNLPLLIPGEESDRLASNFESTQRELFYAPTGNVPTGTDFFLISPDMAIARISENESRAIYGYAAKDDLSTRKPELNPSPNKTDGHHELFYGRIYALLGSAATRLDSDRRHDEDNPTLATMPDGHTAGYYTPYKDGLPVVGKIAESEVVLAAGSSHFGVMTGPAFGRLAVYHTLGLGRFSDETMSQTDIHRDPIEHTGLEL